MQLVPLKPSRSFFKKVLPLFLAAFALRVLSVGILLLLGTDSFASVHTKKSAIHYVHENTHEHRNESRESIRQSRKYSLHQRRSLYNPFNYRFNKFNEESKYPFQVESHHGGLRESHFRFPYAFQSPAWHTARFQNPNMSRMNPTFTAPYWDFTNGFKEDSTLSAPWYYDWRQIYPDAFGWADPYFMHHRYGGWDVEPLSSIPYFPGRPQRHEQREHGLRTGVE